MNIYVYYLTVLNQVSDFPCLATNYCHHDLDLLALEESDVECRPVKIGKLEEEHFEGETVLIFAVCTWPLKVCQPQCDHLVYLWTTNG